MKTKNTLKAAAAVLAIALARQTSAYVNATGDIYDIRRCDYYGVPVDTPAWSAESPMGQGEDIYFRIRLANHCDNTTKELIPWKLNYTGGTATNVFKIGVFASGTNDWAELVENTVITNNGAGYFTDLVFHYRTKPGDFAFPMRLAASATEPVKYNSTTSGEYYINPYTLANFQIVEDGGDGDQAKLMMPLPVNAFSYPAYIEGSAVSAGVAQNMFKTANGGDMRKSDVSLQDAKFYIQAAGFETAKAGWADAAAKIWKQFYKPSDPAQASEIAVPEGADPQIVIDGVPTQPRKFYVWSEDESIAKIFGGTTMNLHKNDSSTTVPRQVGTLVFPADTGAGDGKAYQDFSLQGVASNKTYIVLSPVPDYDWDASDNIHTNFVSILVECIGDEPLAAHIAAAPSELEAAYETVKTAYSTLTVTLTQTNLTAVTIGVHPVPTSVSASDWKDYIHIGDSETYADPGTKDTSDPSVTFTVADMKAGILSKKLYVFARNADANTHGSYNFTFSLSESTSTYKTTSTTKLEVTPAAVEVELPSDPLVIKDKSALSKIKLPLKISGSTYCDAADTATGYTVYFKYDKSGSEEPVSLGKFFRQADGSLLDAGGNAPVISYPAAEEVKSYTSYVTVVAPASGAASVQKEFTATIDPKVDPEIEFYSDAALTKRIYSSSTVTEGDNSIYVRVNLGEPSRANYYAFLTVTNKTRTISKEIFGDSTKQFILAQDTTDGETSGLKISQPSRYSNTGKVLFLDGADDDLLFGVFICTTQTYSASAVVAEYTLRPMDGTTLTVANAKPSIEAVTMGSDTIPDGGTRNYAKEALYTFQGKVSDAGSYDLTTTVAADKFNTHWAVFYEGGTSEDTTLSKTFSGDPNDSAQAFAIQFPEAGTWTVKMTAWDKDMPEAEAASYQFTVNVEEPRVQLSGLPMAIDENDSSYNLKAALNTFDPSFAGRVWVAIGVSAGAGKIEFQNNKAAEAVKFDSSNWNATWAAALGVTVASTNTTDYYIAKLSKNKNDAGGVVFKTVKDTLDGANEEATIWGKVIGADTDGTDGTFDVNAVLPTFAKKAKDYYSSTTDSDADIGVTLTNINPLFTSAGASTEMTNVTISAVSFTIGDKADVAADMLKGLTLTITGVSNPASDTIIDNIHSKTNITITPSFAATGLQRMEVTLTDADGGTHSEAFLYFLSSAKFVTVAPHGPSAGDATIKISKIYEGADGIGEGDIWITGADSAAPDSANNFDATWKAQASIKTVTAFSTGYKVGDTSTYLSTTGGKASGTDNYAYPDATLDSFYFGWIVPASAEAGSEYGLFVSIETGKKQSSAKISLPTDLTGDGMGYPDTYIEALFSKEWRATDNLGDMNSDGVPDYYTHVKEYGTGTDAVPLIEPQGVAGDIGKVDTLNEDLDFYPSGGIAVPGLPSTWTDDTATPFNTFLEVRGQHAGLNYGMFKADKNEYSGGWVSDLDLSYEEKKYLIDSAIACADGTKWAAAKTFADALTNDFESVWAGKIDDYLENVAVTDPKYAAYTASQAIAKKFIDATWAGYVAEDVATWGFTVENRTDPTLEDTDGDGISDGYEYYFWYQATVGTKANDGKVNRYVGKKFNLKDIESPTDIASDDIAAIFNPRIKRDWTKQDTDADGLYDKEEILIGTNPCCWDSDGDGLLDLYEVMWNIDPRKADNDGVNGNMNGDGDYMAHAILDGEYNIYKRATDDTFWAFDAGTEIGFDDPFLGTDYCITGQAFQVAYFKGGWIPTTEWAKDPLLTRNLYLRFAGKAGTVDGPTNVAERVESMVHLYHHQVYNYFGFDPRTGWYINGDNASLSTTKRWLQDGSPILGGSPVNTSPYTARDEFLLIKYRYIMGLRNADSDLSEIAKEQTDKNKKWVLAGIIASGCTNPNAAFEANAVKGDWDDPDRYVSSSRHGADTDGDGVPDGWELYVGVNPNIDFRIPKSSNGHDELYWDGYPSYTVNGSGIVHRDYIGDNEDYQDEWTLVKEYAGTDACLAYQACDTIYANHPANEGSVHYKWYNKYFPTDPRNDDTDGDTILDNKEGSDWTALFLYNRWGQRLASSDDEYREVTYNFIYGDSVDEGSTNRVIRGGGLNPCTVDTDNDGLPDPWEMQYAGVIFQGTEVDKKCFGGSAPDPDYFDDLNAAIKMVANTTNTTPGGWHILMGMDGTFADAVTESDKYPVDEFDWDGDGLQNWQEYQIQCMRHLRYDDFHTPLMGFDAPAFDPNIGLMGDYTNELVWCAGAEDGTGRFLQMSYSERMAGPELDAAEALGYTNFVKFVREYEADDENHHYLRDLGYFALPPRKWDVARIDEEKKYLLPPRFIRQRCLIGETQDYDIDLDTFAIMPIWVYPGIAYDDTDPSTYVLSTNVQEFAYGGTRIYWDADSGYLVEPYLVMTTNTYWTSVRGRYVGTDPRLWDTDRDGMDDYWELFHGLNPILGHPGNLSESTVVTTGGVETVSRVYNAKDIICDSFGTVSTFKNGWIGLNHAWGEDETPPYDFIRYPWMAGIGMCDPDGDGLRNFEEALSPNITSPGGYHTDPSPLWMTDTTSTSVVYRVDEIVEYVTNGTLRVDGSVLLPGDTSVAEVTNKFTNLPVPVAINKVETNLYANLVLGTAPSYVDQYYNVYGLTRSPFGNSKFASYEINEGYDTDGDFRSDRSEMVEVVDPTSDPLDFDDIRRRQSIYFGGAADPGVAVTLDPSTRSADAPDFYKQFTVEAWIYPEEPATGARQCAVARGAEYPGWDKVNSNSVVRMNFALGLDETGRTMVRFDNSTEEGEVEIFGSKAESNKWLHIAGTFDGKTLRLYENAVLAAELPTTMQPANGVYAAMQDPHYNLEFPYGTYSTLASATSVGGLPRSGAFNEAASHGGAITDVAGDFFKGSVDEVRIWDGARTNILIEADYKKAYTVGDVKEYRRIAYEQWRLGYTRNDNDDRMTRDPELLQLYNFTTLPGATSTNFMQKVPAGFETNVLEIVRNPTNEAERLDKMLKVGWWSRVVENPNFTNQVYNSPYAVPWVQNMAAHLPALSGSVADSVFWSANYAGYSKASFNGLSSFAFPNAMNPYSVMSTKLESAYARNKYIKVDMADDGDCYSRYRYDTEMSFSGSTDLVPLGSACAKRMETSWDGDGPEDAWAITTDGTSEDGDPDADGMPDWAKALYDSVEAYRAALQAGLLPDGTTNLAYSVINFLENADSDGDGVSDYLSNLFGLQGTNGLLDYDNDGLSNYSEYLLAKIFDLGPFNSSNAYSISKLDSDYFFRIGEVYAGEIFTDHDWMEDDWEDAQGLGYTSRYAWDAWNDADEDGWSAFAECRYNQFVSTIAAKNASHMLSGVEIRDVPVPAVRLTVRYNGPKSLAATSQGASSGSSGSSTNSASLASLYVSAWRDSAKAEPDAKWIVTPGESVNRTAFLGLWRNAVVGGTLTPGNINPKSFSIAFKSYDSNERYTWRLYDEDGANPILSGGTYEEYLAYVDAYGLYGVAYHNPITKQVTTGRVELVTAGDKWVSFVRNSDITVTTDESTEEGYICLQGERVGTLNCVTGEYTIDLGAFERSALSDATNRSEVVTIANSLVRLNYSATVPVFQAKKLSLSLGLPDFGDPGYLKEGINRFSAFYDLNGNGVYDVDEPFGAVEGVDVGWYKADATLELTDGGRTGSRVDLVQDIADTTFTVSNVTVQTSWTRDSAKLADKGTGRVRVSRYAYSLNNTKSWMNYSGNTGLNRVIFDKVVDSSNGAILTEVDLLRDGEFDIDWNTRSDIATGLDNANPSSSITDIAYLIVLGNGVAGYSSGSDVTSKPETLDHVIVRHFDQTWQKPVAVAPGQNANMGVTSASPTFRWKMTNDTYTAFRVMVTDAAGGPVWDSGLRAAGAMNKNGEYEFTPDLYAGDILEPGSNYQWSVAMYNTKFYPNRTGAVWSDPGTFIVNTLTNGVVYGSIDVAVRYFGPKYVLTNSVVRVEAYSTPDFNGAPVARTWVRNIADVCDTNAAHAVNATLIGLPRGAYYVRGFIDDQTISGTTYGDNRKLDAWEPWGYVANRDGTSSDIFRPLSVTITSNSGTNSVIDLYLEDVDINGNSLPDAWEMLVNSGKLYSTAAGIDTISPSGIMINDYITSNLMTNQLSGTYSSLASMLTKSLKSAGVAALVLNVTPEQGQIPSAALQSAASGVETTAKAKISVDNISVTNGVVVLVASSSDGEVTTTQSGKKGVQKLYAASSTPVTQTLNATIWYSYDLVTWTSATQPVKVYVESDGSTSIDGGNDITIDTSIVTGHEKCFFYITIDAPTP